MMDYVAYPPFYYKTLTYLKLLSLFIIKIRYLSTISLQDSHLFKIVKSIYDKKKLTESDFHSTI